MSAFGVLRYWLNSVTKVSTSYREIPLLQRRKLSDNKAANDNIYVVENNGVRNITLCNVTTRNALSLSMLNDIYAHITNDIDNVDLRSIIINAEGPVFSCGHNLRELKTESGETFHRKIFNKCGQLMVAILECPVPIIAAVNGVATAAGCQLVAACDIAICTDNSSFSLPGANAGIFCSTPSVAVSRRIPKSVVAYMLYTGLPITANQAVQFGLVSKVVEQHKLEEELKIITDFISLKSRSVIQLGKQFFHTQMEMDIKTAYKHGENIMVHNIALKDAQEGISSFLEKRKPNWSHTSET